MEFRQYTNQELSALIGRLSAGWSESSVRELRTLREVLAAAATTAEAALAHDAGKETEHASALVDRLANQADAYAKAAAERVAKDAKTTIEGIRKQLHEQTRENERLASALDEMKAEAGALRSQLQDQLSRATSVERDLAEATRQLEAARTECACIMTQLETEAAARAKLAVALSTAQKLQQNGRSDEPAAVARRHAVAPEQTSPEDVVKLASMPLNRLRAKFQRVETDG